MARVLLFWLVLLPLGAVALDWGAVQMPVSDRSVEARNQALADGLGKVLVRLTADTAAAGWPEARPLLQNAGRWASQFSYQDVAGGLVLQADFDVSALAQELQQQGLPVWSLSRPPVLVWLVTPGAGRGEIIGRQSSASYAASLRAAAQERGFPLLLPHWDTEDQALLQPADIRGQFDTEITHAAARYQTPFVATAVYSGNQIRWRLLRQGEQEASGTVQGEGEAQVLQQLIHELTAAVSPRYIVRPGNEQHYEVAVEGVDSLVSWRDLERYLSGLSGVSRVRTAGTAAGGRVMFDVTFSGTPEQLQELLQMHPQLAPCEPAQASLCWRSR